VVAYYLLSMIGIALGKQNWLSAFFAVWSANIIFTLFGAVLLWQMANGGRVLTAITSWSSRTPKAERDPISIEFPSLGLPGKRRKRRRRTAPRNVFPRILDEYVVREFLNTFFLVLCGFVLLMLVFTFFEIMGDILRNHIPVSAVGAYLLNLAPSMIYQIAPLAVLIGVLVTFGVLNRNSEIVAMKATGISLYRLVIPILCIAAMLSISLFLFDDYFLPQANRKQEALHNLIKGRPAQTVLHPEKNWIFGQPRPGESARIFYYQYFDRDRDEFVNLSVFEFDATTFALSRRIFAARAVWEPTTSSWAFLKGWQREIKGANVADYHEFAEASFPEIHEDPGYFVKEKLQSQEMNFGQLDSYIGDLRQSGFDTMRLRVELWHKLAYPLVAIVMAMLAIPFALSMGRRGSLTGIAVAIGVALVYYVVDNFFGALGNVNYLPAAMAAWSSDILFGLVGFYLLLRTPT